MKIKDWFSFQTDSSTWELEGTASVTGTYFSCFLPRLAPQCSPLLQWCTPFHLHKISSSSQNASVMYHLKFFSGMKYLPSDLWPQAITCQGNLAGLNPLTG